MEDGLQKELKSSSIPDDINNGVVTTVMANFPEGIVADTEKEVCNQFGNSGPKFNGSVHSSDEADNDSDADALIIDESVPKRRVKKRKLSNRSKSSGDNCEESEVVLHSNPYFNQSLFELSLQHNNSQTGNEASNKSDDVKTVGRLNKSKRIKTKNSPKLREYAQYLGLQPAVQFKCSKCRQSGFETLQSLNEHLVNCTADPSAFAEVEDSSVSSFKLTRKVFLCSACGTYYENWNLYMHMLEYHRRYICLYCLGMFSVLDDLCQHIQSRHNWEPHHLDTPEEFFKDYKEPCFIICCECKKLFNEQDNFFYHNCVPCENSSSKNTSNKTVKNKCNKQLIRPENHVTGDSIKDNSNEINTGSVDGASDSQVNITNCEMVRSEVNVSESSEILPEMAGFKKKSSVTELTLPEIANQDAEDGDSYEKEEQTEKQESDLEESFSMEMNDKQASSNLTVDTSNDEIKDENSDRDNMNSPSFSEKPIYDQSSRDSNMKSNDNSDLEEIDNQEAGDMSLEENVEPLETRKVPKLSLKLPKLDSYSKVEPDESDDSDKQGMEVDQIESENEYLTATEEKVENVSIESDIQVAGFDVSIVELELEQPLDKFDIKILLQKCLLATVPSCVYCNHARKIAVNGRQLGLHAISQHRYSAIVKSITEEELIPESFVNRIKESLGDLDKVYFNLESNLTEEVVTFSHVFECFQCRYSTNVHKELYLHNRKMHTKNLLLCIMCKSNFYSYSELICHLCPGDYVLDHEIQYRCCMCVNDDLPSAFRLMVHLRKRHHVCDVCLEMCHNQYKLSNHVWKHKLHHFCYRCGIAYRNKQDITRHLFWKHGTESVLCKKCLQKKWPHVFHFCIPPAVFTCEECGLNLTKAVYLKVHKRFHSDEKPHSCTFEGCEQSFISKKLLQKHEQQHLEPSTKEESEDKKEVEENHVDNVENASVDVSAEEKTAADKPKPKVDVYDLPELNLSESSDSESENEAPKQDTNNTEEEENIIETLEERTLEVEQELANTATVSQEDQTKQSKENVESAIPILESIWDDFKIYQAKREKIDTLFGESDKADDPKPKEAPAELPELTAEIALLDHDYFYNPESSQNSNVIIEMEPDLSQRVDHDYCTPKETTTESTEKENKDQSEPTEAKKPAKSDDSSSDSDSSSCSCGSNCSCSSDSSSSSSSDSSDSDSSTEEGRKRQQQRRENKNTGGAKTEQKESEPSKVEPKVDNPSTDAPILETDLDTTESETDEEFYDKQPQKLARKLLEEKRNQILAEVGSLPNGNLFENSRNSTPSLPEEVKHKKKLKTKKRKKKKSERKEASFSEYAAPSNVLETPYPAYQSPVVAPLTISLNKMSPLQNQHVGTPSMTMTPDHSVLRQDADSNLRASKRRRVPNKFYGYSSDEEGDKSTPTSSKWRKVEPQVPIQRNSPLTVPPITIKTGAASSKQTVEPITIRQTAKFGELKVHQRQQAVPAAPPRVPPLQINTSLLPRTVLEDPDSDSNESATEEIAEPEQPPKVPVYCYCKCPYDEVSEMIGCDSHDCEIEWFHFECVGIMVPPKGQWFCPECRKKKQRRELLNY